MDGILLIDKPTDFTSFDVIAKLRGIAHQRKIGHSGTLDPMATGVLLCLMGRATRLCDLLLCEDKTYLATVRFGVETDTQDVTGTIVSQNDASLSACALTEALDAFRGEIAQTPPMYSAISVGGRRLYDLARQGIEVKRPKRDVHIDTLDVLSYDEETRIGCFEVACSKGTYVRTLFHDLGQHLGVGATLSALRRTMANGFAIDDCVTLQQAETLAADGMLATCLLPVSQAFTSLPRLTVGDWQATMLKNGVPLCLNKLGIPLPGRYAVYGEDDVFLGLGMVKEDAEGILFKQL
ncbi:MAG: tRNA pseudouridine(55) synthase TruB [Oscillospiraceae bacterium]